MLFFPITFSFDFYNMGMMYNAVNSSNGHYGIGEYLIPLTEGLIGGNNQTATFIAMCYELEQHLCFTVVLFNISDIINDQYTVFIHARHTGH